MTSKQPPVPPESLADEFEALAPATDRVRLVGLDHARRLQSARIGATERRTALTRARRADDVAELTRLQTTLAMERRVSGAYERAVGRGEIEVPERKADAFVIHGLVFGTDGAPAPQLTVAAISGTGEVRRFTCTDARGYFRMELPVSTGGDNLTRREAVFLQVSDAEQVVLYRGDEAHILAEGEVVYREIRLSGERLPPCPIPPDRATMPKLLDLPEAQALAILGRFGLKLAQRLTQTAPQRAGLVISQEPAAGTPITSETQVTLVIGVAEEGDTVEVPNLVGKKQETAEKILEEAGLRPGQVSFRDDRRVGLVLSHTPPAGERVAKGAVVDLVVGRQQDPERTEVPGVIRQTLAGAREILGAARLKIGDISGPESGIVVEQKPEAGTVVPVGTAVSLRMARQEGTTPGERFADDLTKLITLDPGFEALGISPDAVYDGLLSNGITNIETAKGVVDMEDAALQTMFGLRNRNHARSFRRMLRESLEQT